MKDLKLPADGHDIHETFSVNDIKVTLTPADHAWQNEVCCGFSLDTPDGTIWAPGDSRFMEEHLHRKAPDSILFDFSDSVWHIGLEGAVKLADAYPDTPLILWHWGCIDAPEMKEFNGDPDELARRIVNPRRIVVLAPGEPWKLKGHKGSTLPVPAGPEAPHRSL
jgi:L-ascorbate metabolism protein UlaG (beta-lactamase superfamily)